MHLMTRSELAGRTGQGFFSAAARGGEFSHRRPAWAIRGHIYFGIITLLIVGRKTNGLTVRASIDLFRSEEFNVPYQNLLTQEANTSKPLEQSENWTPSARRTPMSRQVIVLVLLITLTSGCETMDKEKTRHSGAM